MSRGTGAAGLSKLMPVPLIAEVTVNVAVIRVHEGRMVFVMHPSDGLLRDSDVFFARAILGRAAGSHAQPRHPRLLSPALQLRCVRT